ncbi:hypothetical protein RB195_023129 [Necator americanus]|uniref:DUF7083 domain-containing protein n=1 Tax=Necator americanus TaxID=51031 RepID=A0ABR1EI66_NECAM
MDAETLRTILEAQTKAQQQMFTELIKRKEKMASASHPAVPTAPVATADFSRILYRHACLISCTIRKMAKARLIVSKLDAVTYARFTNHILPKRACDVPLTDTVAVLKERFAHNTSVFARRYSYLKKQRNEEIPGDYTELVNQPIRCSRVAMAAFNDVIPEQT